VELDPVSLSDDVEALRAIVLAQHAEIAGQRELIGRLRLQLTRLRRMQFGRSSERLAAEADQLELALEELEADTSPPARPDGAAAAGDDDEAMRPERRKPARRPLPDHLPRETV
jgi:transposase